MNKITCICLGVRNNQKKEKYYSSVGSKGYTIGNKTKRLGQPHAQSTKPRRKHRGIKSLMQFFKPVGFFFRIKEIVIGF